MVSTKHLICRPITNDDLQQLAVVYMRVFEDPELNEHWTEESAHALLADWYKRQPDLALAAACDDRLVGGFVVGIRPWWDGNHLVDGELFVDPEYQGRGIGRELVRQTLKTAVQRYSPVVWESYTFHGQEFPLSWYKRLGFREIQEWVMIRADVAELITRLG